MSRGLKRGSRAQVVLRSFFFFFNVSWSHTYERAPETPGALRFTNEAARAVSTGLAGKNSSARSLTECLRSCVECAWVRKARARGQECTRPRQAGGSEILEVALLNMDQRCYLRCVDVVNPHSRGVGGRCESMYTHDSTNWH